ncbi:MAG: glycosyltransferase family 2 protein [Candidatus Bathyarchaeia archaeon]
MPLRYWVIVVGRNAAKTITNTIESLIHQSIQPTKIVVVDDGSTDGTHEILSAYSQKYQQIKVIDRPNEGYDIRRVPKNINLSLQSNIELETDYTMISGDDCEYPTNYCESVMGLMTQNPRVVVASGYPSQFGLRTYEHTPSGSGRIIKTTFLKGIGFKFPVKAGWEAWLLYEALQSGYQTKLLRGIPYIHVRPRGAKHAFIYWGAAMYTLGYHPLYALGRITKNMAKGHSLRSSVGLLRGYLTAKIGSSDPFLSPFGPSFRRFVHQQQSREISRVISTRRKIFY